MITKIRRPLVIGYKGEIGSFILNGLLRTMPKASNIWCFDVNESEKEKIERIRKADCIFLCVPLQDTRSWIKSYKRLLNGKVVVEQCSLKSFLGDDYFNQIKFIHMHILFRPSVTPKKEDRTCLLLDKNISEPIIQQMESILSCKINVERMSVFEHDTVMAYNQSLVHRSILVLNDICFHGSDTYINKKIKELSDRIRSGNEKLYEAIQRNPHTEEAIRKFADRMLDFDIRNMGFNGVEI